MKLLILFFGLFSQAFVQPEYIQCTNAATIAIHNNGSIKTYYKKAIKEKIADSAVIEFLINKKPVAKLYPQAGSDFVIIDKKQYVVQTDNKTFWKLNAKNSQTLFSCGYKVE